MNKNKIYNLIIVVLLLIVSACNLNKNHFRMSTSVMYPNAFEGDIVKVDKSDRKFSYGDMIVCHHKALGEYQNMIGPSRIVGLPGDSIYVKHEICVINNKENRSKLTQKKTIKDYGPSLWFDEYEEIFPNEKKIRILIYPADDNDENITEKIKIPKNYYFIMGDNRNDSYDSRHFGPIHKDSIIGKVVEIIPAQ